MDKNIYQIISDEDINTLYQPIVSLITGEVMGYEALSRGPEWSSLFSPVALIKSAEFHGLSYELEELCRKKAIQNISNLEKSQKLFININPNILKKTYQYKDLTMELPLNKNIEINNIVYELTERSMIEDYNSFNRILNTYKDAGYRIAIDDVGAGYSGLRTIRETKPNYIKIDMELIRDIDTDSIKEAMINAFLNFSITTNIKLIAEGIETEAELAKLIDMGVHYGQGYFLQRPQPTLGKLRDDVITIIQNNNNLQQDMHLFNNAKDMIGSIANNTCHVTTNTFTEKVKSAFETNGCEGMCVVDHNKPVGIIMRENLLYVLSSRYGLSLYAKKPIGQVMDSDFLIVDYHTSISEVSRKAMARDRNKTYDIVVITLNGNFFGIVSINTLLRHLITIETAMAKELNPLTHLPGNIVINRVLNDMLLYKPKSCAIVYIDFDFFKPYNDIYGFESGDRFIKKVSAIILDNVKKSLPYNSFVGHIGGDDFIFVIETSKENIEYISQKIIEEFENIKDTLYTPNDYERGYILAKDRNNNEQHFNLVTLSIAGIYNNLDRFESVEDISKYMSKVKKSAKAIEGNSIIIE